MKEKHPSPKHPLPTYRGKVGEKVLNIITPLLRRRGFIEGRLLQDWDQIVGLKWGAFSCPEKIQFLEQKREGGTLFIRVWGGVALEMQHQVLSILDRINGYFGYRALERLSFKQAPSSLPSRSFASIDAFCTPLQRKYVQGLVDEIPQEDLRKALSTLGEEVLKAENKKG